MSRLEDIKQLVREELNGMPDLSRRDKALEHLFGVSLAAGFIAERRGLNHELPAIAGALHDIAAYMYGSYDDHAHKGAEYARRMLEHAGLTNAEETDLICSMIYHHDDKHVIDSPLDEVLKDADVIHHCFADLSKPVKEKERLRFNALIQEFHLSTNPME
ncbi:MAG: HD domain-containing protein [Solobacterium sp.]|nr:HD domain-containing protein [Solobacterium sp.]